MKKVMLTGGTGFVGRNVLPILSEKCKVIAPTRQELDLKDTDAVREFVEKGKFDVILHCANPNPVKNKQYDSSSNMLEDSMRTFMNLSKVSHLCEKILYLGSGAEYDKTKDIVQLKEEEVTRSLPKDIYGCSKYIMNEIAKKSENIYNLRLFACYGPYDHESKFITHAIRCCLEKREITIKQNCYFDYLQVFDLARVIERFIDLKPQYHDYNIASGTRISLEEIAKEVKRQLVSDSKIVILNEGWNKEYTANIERLDKETGVKKDFISIESGITIQIAHEKEMYQ